MEYSMEILGLCPECNSYQIGLIVPGDPALWLRHAKKLYKRHRHLLKYVSGAGDEAGIDANRFCLACANEWRQPEGAFGRGRYVHVEFDGEKGYRQFLQETEFSFRAYEPKKKENAAKRAVKHIWNLLFARIYRL